MDGFRIDEFNVSIVGFGLMGASYALAIKKFNRGKIYAIDIDEGALKKAKERGMADEIYTDPAIPLKKSDLVIICLYPKLLINFVKENRNNFKPGTIITDITGVKCDFVDKINGILPEDVDFVFAHPMAGRESKGLEYADGEIFRGANYIVIPNDRNKRENVEYIKAIAMIMGFGKITVSNPKEHDALIAYTSQLTHAIAVALVNSDDEKSNTQLFIGDSYRDLTRIAKINPELWSELFLENKENLIEKISSFQNEMDIIREALINDDRGILEERFRESSKRKDNMNSK